MRTPCVLVVEDNELLRRVVSDLAADAGLRVVGAANGAAGLRLIAEDPPDIVVTDIYMPTMDGGEFIQRVRQTPACFDTPIIVLTADDSRETRIEMLRVGADDVLQKPLDQDEFLAKLRALLRQRRLGVAPLKSTDPTLRAAEARLGELQRLVEALVCAADGQTDITSETLGNHARRITGLSVVLGRALGCENEYVDQIRRYAALFDVGKGLVDRSLTGKAGPLQGDEIESIRAHTRLGCTLLRGAGLPVIAQNMALSHHERWDGRGYPDGLARDAIPLEARILAVAEVYDALTAPRNYRPPWSIDRARAFVGEGAGTQFDPAVVRVFHEQHAAVLRIAQVLADDPHGHEVVLGR